MASVDSEYERFLDYLEGRNVHEDVLRMANLILFHLPNLAEVGAVRRARSTRLAPFAVRELVNTSVKRPAEWQEPEANPPFGRLHQLKTGPFRGFMREEAFDLSHDITLVYGANGTGKSSFCEALEIAMLGAINEAQVKRIDHQIYCNNARLHRHVVPELFACREPGAAPVIVRPNDNDYRFCFIEKNRLNDFARIAARTPGDQRQLIATLFGVDQFSEFVRGFNPSLDDNLTLVSVKAQQLEQRRSRLAMSEQVILSYPQRVEQFERQEQELAQRILPGNSFQVCSDWMLGTPEQQGRLPYLHAQLEGVPPIIYEVTAARLRELLAESYRLQHLWQTETAALTARAGEVSYSKLYQAVLDLADGATACPACGTALDAVVQNPFERARGGLQQLAELAAIQQREGDFRNQLNESIRALWDEMKRLIAAVSNVCPEEYRRANLPILPPTHTGIWLDVWIENDQRAWNALLALATLVEQSDAGARAVHAQRSELAKERARLDDFRLEIERLKTMRATAHQELTQAQQTVVQFDEANRDLITEVAAEAGVIAHHQRIKAAYDGFLPELQGYLSGLPALLLKGLGEQAKELFNLFNRHDPENDQLHALWFPLAENGKIEIEFAGEAGVRYDALVVLSEGHIKCLGLAILLAKNILQECPVVIFDDVVNAIDDEHRDGIWRTFFEEGLLDGKQIILTSHAEEFLHRIQQELGVERAETIKRYKFLPHLGDHELLVDSEPPTKNYVILAQQALAQDEKRDALRYVRPALESLTDQIWTWLGRRTDARLEIKLSGPRLPWELNNKCTKLRGAINRVANQYKGAPEIVEALNALLGVSGTSIEWGYLNGGVHDAQRDHEFDRNTVRTMVNAVTSLDAALAVLRNR